MLLLKKMLVEHGWSQARFARLAEINESRMSDVLSAGMRPGPLVFGKLAAAAQTAFGWTGNPADLLEEVPNAHR